MKYGPTQLAHGSGCSGAATLIRARFCMVIDLCGVMIRGAFFPRDKPDHTRLVYVRTYSEGDRYRMVCNRRAWRGRGSANTRIDTRQSGSHYQEMKASSFPLFAFLLSAFATSYALCARFSSSVQPLAKPVELKATTGKYPNGERHGEVSLKREDDGPHKHRSAQSGDQPSQHDRPSFLRG